MKNRTKFALNKDLCFKTLKNAVSIAFFIAGVVLLSYSLNVVVEKQKDRIAAQDFIILDAGSKKYICENTDAGPLCAPYEKFGDCADKLLDRGNRD